MGLLQKVLSRLRARSAPVILQSSGVCPTCNRPTQFIARDPWLRDHFLCRRCGSLPRERALMVVVDELYPNWRELRIHESSPADRGASRRLAAECPNYLATQYFPDVALGQSRDGLRCESLEALTFADQSFDLHITQDVLEHVFHPERVFSEIARTLKSGGAHICTVPLVRGSAPSRPRAVHDADGMIQHLEPPEYHGNPISERGSLVTMDWGFDICEHVQRSSGLTTTIERIDDLGKGIRAEYIEVLVMKKD